MAEMVITINASKLSVQDMNDKLKDASNPNDGINQLEILMNAINAGAIDATVDVAVTTGDSVTYELK